MSQTTTTILVGHNVMGQSFETRIIKDEADPIDPTDPKYEPCLREMYRRFGASLENVVFTSEIAHDVVPLRHLTWIDHFGKKWSFGKVVTALAVIFVVGAADIAMTVITYLDQREEQQAIRQLTEEVDAVAKAMNVTTPRAALGELVERHSHAMQP